MTDITQELRYDGDHVNIPRSSRVMLDDVSPRHPARAWQLCDVVLHSFAGVKDAR